MQGFTQKHLNTQLKPPVFMAWQDTSPGEASSLRHREGDLQELLGGRPLPVAHAKSCSHKARLRWTTRMELKLISSSSSTFFCLFPLWSRAKTQPLHTESILPALLPKRTGWGPQQQSRLPAHRVARFLITRFLVVLRAATEDLQAEGPPQSSTQRSDASSSAGSQPETEARALSQCHHGAYASQRMNCSSPFNHLH